MENNKPIWFAAISAVLVVAGLWLQSLAIGAWAQLVWCATGFFAVGGVLGFWALSERWIEVRERLVWILQARQKALAMTPQTVLSENMKQMHPTAVSTLMLYGRMTWMIIPGATPNESAEHVLYGTQCTWAFIAEFLKASTDTACVAEWRFANDGAKKYAPHAMRDSWCTDREQYQQFVAFLYGLARITLAFSNQPPAWIPPWNPTNIARTMGIRFEEDEEEEQEEQQEEAVQS